MLKIIRSILSFIKSFNKKEEINLEFNFLDRFKIIETNFRNIQELKHYINLVIECNENREMSNIINLYPISEKTKKSITLNDFFLNKKIEDELKDLMKLRVSLLEKEKNSVLYIKRNVTITIRVIDDILSNF